MTQALLQKRMHLVALTALLALVAAMFLAVGGGRAQTAANVIVFNDSDATVAAGTDISAILVENTPTAAYGDGSGGEAVQRWIITGGLTFESGGTVSGTTASAHGAGAVTIVTTGAADGTYKLYAEVGTGATKQTFEGDVTVGEAGTAVATATIELGNEIAIGEGTPAATAATPETGVSPASGLINVVIKVQNSLGAAANDADVSSVIVFAGANGRVANSRDVSGTGPTAAPVNFSNSIADGGATNAFAIGSVNQTAGGSVTIHAIVQDSAGGSVRSNDLTLSFSGGPHTISAAPAKGSLNVAAPGATVNTGSAFIEVSAKSASDSTVAVPTDGTDAGTTTDLLLNSADITVAITDADGVNVLGRVATLSYATRAATDTTGTANVNETLISANALAIVIAPGADNALPAGTYTVKVTLGVGSRNVAESSFNVVGALETIEVTADKSSVAIGETVVVTATLKDANGLPVKDGLVPTGTGDTRVENDADDVVFTSAGALKLVGFSANVNGQVVKEVKNGTASATFVATEGSGTVTILVNSAGKTGSVSLTRSVAPVDDATETEAPTPVATTIELSHIEADYSAANNNEVTVTADVKDQNGAAVPDGTMVRFDSVGGGTLFGPSTVQTSNGMATAQYVNLTDDLWIVATSGSARSATLQVAVTSAAEQAAADAAAAQDAADMAEAERVANAEQAAADAAQDAADAAAAAAAATTAADAQDAADDAQDAADDAQEAADEAGTDAAQDSADAAQASADAAQASADAKKAEEDAQAEADAQAERDAQAEADAQRQAEADAEAERQAQILATVRAELAAAAAAGAAADAATAAAAAMTAADAQAYADKAQASADEAAAQAEIAGTDAAQASADAAQASADAAQASADDKAQAEADAKAEAERVAAEAAQAEADRIAAEEAAAAAEAARRAMPASVSISSTPADLADGTIVTVTISVTDHDDQPVADGTTVSVVLGGSLDLNAVVVGTGTINGAVTAVYIVDGDMGSATIVASAGDAVGTTTLTIAAPEPVEEPEPVEVHDASGLASQTLNSFTSWIASNSSTASQVFASLASRGATSLQLWNGTTWLRYSMVDGAMVPGSVDFTINTGDVLYIGG